MTDDQKNALLGVAHCPRFTGVQPAGDCATILNVQIGMVPGNRQVPEPWRGSPDCPLLFVSSNPSIDAHDDSPREASADEHILNYYERGLPDTFPRIRLQNGLARDQAVRFWSFVRGRAAELWQRPAVELIAGRHFAITELVHCKSTREIGVPHSLPTCKRMHWGPIMRALNACVVVILGRPARDSLGLSLPSALSPDQAMDELAGRWVLTLPHSNAHTARRFENYYDSQALAPVRKALQSKI